MPRRARFVPPGVPHHITQRGNNRQDVFLCDEDRLRYLEFLRDKLQQHGVRIMAWCLMSNHVHLVAVPDSSDSLALALGQAHARYALDWNRRHNRVGHLWQNRFFSCSLDRGHLLQAMRYVEQNPARARMVASASQWRWSSAAAHTNPAIEDALLDPQWRHWWTEARLGEWDFEGWFRMMAEAQSEGEVSQVRRATQTGEPFGPLEFIREMEAASGRRLKVLDRGRPPKQPLAAVGSTQGLLF